jgi:adenylosuccinate lyase
LLRNLGVALAHCLIGYKALLRGLDKIVINETRLLDDLAQHWEVLAEAIQTVMRRYGIPEPYEKLKTLTRGEALTSERLQAFIHDLELPAAVKEQLLTLRPESYIGLAANLAKSLT